METINAGEKRRIVLVHDRPESAERVIRLAGEGAEVEVEEVFLTGDVASKLIVIHDAPRTVSRVRSRGVVGKSQSTVAHAVIRILEHAQLSDSFVSQKFLLLHDSANADAIPSLEVEADDVKAGHAAAVAPLDEEKVFYVCSRGVAEGDARRMVVEGFLAVPEGFEHLVEAWQV